MDTAGMVREEHSLEEFFAAAAEKCGIGDLAARPQRVSGGFMHRMYRLDAQTGSYALKLLNPEIMKRPAAQKNYRLAERLEKQLDAAGLPVVTALEFGGEKMQLLDGRHFYLFPWVEGKALTPHEVQPRHCRQIGEILARQHALRCDKEPEAFEGLQLPWEELFAAAKEKGAAEIVQMLEKHLGLLCRLRGESCEAMKRLSRKVCISNGDMDIKNVLWQRGKPMVIDLECLDYGHPEREMLMLALMWAGWEQDQWKPENLAAFVESYTALRGQPETDWDTLYKGMDVWSEWLEYNVRRALGIEVQDEEEQQLGLQQARFAMERILFAEKIRPEVLEIVSGKKTV